MIRNGARKVASKFYAASGNSNVNVNIDFHFARGLSSLKCVIGGSQKGKGQYGSDSHQKDTSMWPSMALGMAFGAAGLTYLTISDDQLALCERPMSRPRPGVPQKAQETQSEVPPPPTLPKHVPYLIIGAGTAAMAAYRSIRTREVNARVLLVGEEEYNPYMRPPLSKDMWFCEKSLTQENKFKTWSGKDRSIFFEKDSYYCSPTELSASEKGGVAVLTGHKVNSLNTSTKQATLSNGVVISYDKCLIATGGRPRNLEVLETAGADLMKKVTLFRNIKDFRRLDDVTDSCKSVIVIGGGFLGSELACALGKKSTARDMTVTQVFPESGNMGRVLPAYLSEWSTGKVKSENVNVLPGVSVSSSRLSEDGSQVELSLSNGQQVSAEHIVVAVGLEPNTELADSAGLEVDSRFGGFLVNAELEAATDVWVAGDAACFYDVKLGRRRVEHHDHAVVSGRLAGENMTGASRRFLHQSMFWSDLGPDVGYEAIGLVSSDLPTVSVFAKSSAADTPAAVEEKTGESLRSETEQNKQTSTVVPQLPQGAGDKFGKGVIFYMKGKRVVGVVCWNVFNKIGIARKIIGDGAEHEDLAELAKLFDLHQLEAAAEV